MRLLFPAHGKQISFLSVARLVLPLAAILALVIAGAPPARAQGFADGSKWELGGHYAFLTLPSQCSGGSTCETSNSGLGANVTYNFSPWIAIDTEMDFFGSNGDTSTSLTGGNVTEGLFGLRFGPTTRRWGFYSVVRPGFVNFGRVLGSVPAIGTPAPAPASDAIPSLAPTAVPRFSAVLNYQASAPSPVSMLGFTRATDFAFNYGESIEYRPTKHVALRFDIGDTIVSYPGATLGTQYHEHNFQISEALVFRF